MERNLEIQTVHGIQDKNHLIQLDIQVTYNICTERYDKKSNKLFQYTVISGVTFLNNNNTVLKEHLKGFNRWRNFDIDDEHDKRN